MRTTRPSSNPASRGVLPGWRHGVRLNTSSVAVRRGKSRQGALCCQALIKVSTSSVTEEVLPSSTQAAHAADLVAAPAGHLEDPASADTLWEVVEGACDPDIEDDPLPTAASHASAHSRLHGNSGAQRVLHDDADEVLSIVKRSKSPLARYAPAGSINEDDDDFLIDEDEDDEEEELAAPAPARIPVAAAVGSSSSSSRSANSVPLLGEPRKLQFNLLLEAARRREPEEPDYSLEAENYARSARPSAAAKGAAASSASSSAAAGSSIAISTSGSSSSSSSVVARPVASSVQAVSGSSVSRGTVLAAAARRYEPEEDYSYEAEYESFRNREISRISGGSGSSSGSSSRGSSSDGLNKSASGLQVGHGAANVKDGTVTSSDDDERDVRGSSYLERAGSSYDSPSAGRSVAGNSSSNGTVPAQTPQVVLAAPPELMEQIRALQDSLQSIRQAQHDAEARAERAEQATRDAHSALRQAQEVSSVMVQHYNTLREELEAFKDRHLSAPAPAPTRSTPPSPAPSSAPTSSSTALVGTSLRRSSPTATSRTPNPVRGPTRTTPTSVRRSATREGGEEHEDERDEQMLLLQLELDEVSVKLDKALRDLRAHQLVLCAQHELSLHLNGLPANIAQYIYEAVDSGSAPVLGDGGSGSVHCVKIPSAAHGPNGETIWQEVAVKVVPLYDINTTRAYHLRDICPLFLRPRTPHLDVPLATFLRLKHNQPAAKPAAAAGQLQGVKQQQPQVEGEEDSTYYLYTVWPRRHMDVDQLLCSRQLLPGEILTIMHHTVLAVHDLHAARMVHADIKPPNILVMLDKEGWVRSAHLTDFGSVQYVDAGSEAAPAIWDGQMAWNWPPEQRDLVFLNGCDAWGLALLYSCMRAKNPTKPELAEVLQDDSTPQAVFDRVRDKELLPDSPNDPPEIRTLTRLMRRCVIRNPLKRPSLSELMHTTQALLSAYQQFRQP